MILPFQFARIPHVTFGQGTLARLPAVVPDFCSNAVLVTGGKSLKRSGKFAEIDELLAGRDVNYFHVSVKHEPSPQVVDAAVEDFRTKNVHVVIAVGGGSVIDAGKAISAMLPQEGSVRDFLEGVGTRQHDGAKVPFIAIPTTSGTGSEATKNAVISEVGKTGFKKSLRHDNLVPDFAIIDPELMVSCPPDVTAACGMDALTQLLEAYVSSAASPMTDALAWSGLEAMKDNVVRACTSCAGDVEVRAQVAYGSFTSGVTLANAGLGIVHGLASPLGGFFEVPHGVVCGTLLAEATRGNIEALKGKGADGQASLEKHARVGALLAGEPYNPARVDHLCHQLVEMLATWTEELGLPRLGEYGVTEADLDRIVASAGLKNNPVPLEPEQVKRIVEHRL